MNRCTLVVLLVGVVAGCAGVPATFQPVSPVAPDEFSPRLFGGVLKDHVSDGRVNYPALQSDSRLSQYLDQLDRVDPNGLSGGDRLAFWINAYNAFAIKGILDGESPAPYVAWYRYFKVRDYAVGGARLNLYELEHGILRKQFREPRVHFAIVCASVSCPKLQSWIYEGAALDRQLDEAAREFINDATRNRFDRTHRIARLSKIFDWFEEDFAAAAGSVSAFMARYVDDPELATDLKRPGYRIEYLDYDWSLNGPPPQR